MSTWQPSEGLKRVFYVVAEIEQAMEACGISPPSLQPAPYQVFRHRLADIVAKALDGAIEDAHAKPIAAVAVTYTNGHAEKILQHDTFAPMREGDAVTITNGPHAGAYTVGEPVTSGDVQVTPIKKARGRPKGSTKKKAKAAKAEKAVEAQQAE